MHEREAFRAIFSFGGTLSSLPPADVANLGAALLNSRSFARETVAMLRAIEATNEATGEESEEMVA